MQTLLKIRGRYLMVLIAMCGIVASTVGILTNTAGIFFTPIAQELHQETASVNLTLTISNLCFALAGMLSARLDDRRYFRPALIVCTCIFAGGTAALSFSKSLMTLYLFNAIRGFAGGLIGNVLATTVISKWFLTDTGLISSLALSFSGFIGAIFNPILEAVIRASGWRTAYLVSAAAILLFNLPAMLLPISYRPETSGMDALAAGNSGGNAAKTMKSHNSTSVTVMLLAICIMAFAAFLSAIPQLFKPLSITYGLAETGIIMMTIVLVMNTCGKFIFGMMTDRLGVRRSILIYGTVIGAGIMLLLCVHKSVPMLISASMIGLCYSIPTVGAVMLCRELFSLERYGQIFPMINLAGTLANAVGYPILGMIYDATGSYTGALILVFVLEILSIAGVILVYRIASNEDRQR